MENRLRVLILFLFLAIQLISCNKYSHNVNDNEDKRDFRMGKVNLLWQKAKKVLQGHVLSDLYADLKVQDKKELDSKTARAENQDPDGLKEAAVRSSFVGIIRRYHLEKHFPIENYGITGDQVKKAKEPVIKDDNLKTLWKKALMEGFSEDELSKLKEEFGHQQMKIDEYDALKVEYEQLHDQVDNSVENVDDQDELWKSMSIKKKDLKSKHGAIRDKLAQLQLKASSPQPIDGREFKDSRVYHLWALAQKSNMTEEERESLKRELTHFEHRITKHDILQSQVQKSAANLKEGDTKEHVKHEELKNRVDQYARKVEKYHEDLKQKVNKALQHSEL